MTDKAKDVENETRNSVPLECVVIRWIPMKAKMPPLNHNVLIWRCGGQNQDHVAFGYRTYKYGKSKEEWEWKDTSGWPYNYYGIAVDGSEITHWAELPDEPLSV